VKKGGPVQSKKRLFTIIVALIKKKKHG